MSEPLLRICNRHTSRERLGPTSHFLAGASGWSVDSGLSVFELWRVQMPAGGANRIGWTSVHAKLMRVD